VIQCVAIETIVAVSPELALGYDAERADRRQDVTFLTVQRIDAIAVDDQLARVATRQVQVPRAPSRPPSLRASADAPPCRGR